MEHIGFPSIKQYSDVVRYVSDRMQFAGNDANGKPTYHPYTVKKPTLKFRGTPKMHGSNAAAVLHVATGEIFFQSRYHLLTLEKDLWGFMAHMVNKKSQVMEIATAALAQYDKVPEYVAIFGEWCGGSVQPGIALSKLPEMFCIFAIKMVDGKNADGSHKGDWIDIATIKHIEFPEDRIYNTLRFGQWEFEIDFERPKIFQNDLADLTIAIEDLCPVGKHFDVEGIGEGMIWSCVEEGWDPYRYSFKVVGQKHAKTKRKELAQVDIEVVKALEDFIDNTVTQARLEQAMDTLVNIQNKPFALTSQGDFARWVYNDIVKEEMASIEASNLDPKKLGAPISAKARYWYIEQLKAAGVV